MIYITGDTHCPTDMHKLNTKHFNSKNLTKDDYVIICGDAGFVWHGTDNEDLYWQKWLAKKPWTTLFVDGNHENHDSLDAMSVEEWNGGKIHRINDSILHLMRGQVYNINNKTIFTMGGAESIDKGYRKNGIGWWAREMPSESEYTEAINNLKKHNNTVDYIITHCAPCEIQACLGYHDHNQLNEFLSSIMASVDFKQWFCGHYHTDETSAMDNRFELVYDYIHNID